MSKKSIRLWSVLLAMVMVINMLPMSVLAEEAGRVGESTTVEQTETGEAWIVEEVIEGRSEYAKEFLLSNGLHIAAVYDHPVHYQENGQWKEIDNTLKLASTRSGDVYTNTAGSWHVLFPDALTRSNGITVIRDDYSLNFRMAGELRYSGGGNEVMSSAGSVELSNENIADTSAASSGTLSGTDILDIISYSDNLSVQDPATEVSAVIPAVNAETASEDTAYAQTEIRTLYSQLQYGSVYNNTDIIFELSSYMVKESVVINRYDSALYGYSYILDVGKMTPVLDESGVVSLYDGTTLVMSMPAPYLLDSAGTYSYDVEVSLDESDGIYVLSYRLPRAWLAEEDRQWPVILDPAVIPDVDKQNIQDHTITERNARMTSAGCLICGYDQVYLSSRIYLRYVELPALTSADVIVDATVRLHRLESSTNHSPIEVHKVNENWNINTITWADRVNVNPKVEDYANYQEGEGYYWNVTDIVREWYAGENTGMVFKMSDAVESATVRDYIYFYSADFSFYQILEKPTLIITFRNNNGLEGYWDYTSASAGRAGIGFVNQYTGNLVWTHSDIGFGGNLMPVSISHIYNAGDSTQNTFGMGYGWRTNFNQRVYHWNETAAYGDYYIWEDADGTKHYFGYESDGTYKDEDGMELSLTVTSTEYTITDRYGNKSVFDSDGLLTQQVNNQATTSNITIAYNSSGKISAVTDGAGRFYVFTYGSTSGLLESISYKGMNGASGTTVSSVEFAYDTSSNLISITYPDDKCSSYTYTNHLLTSAADIDGYTIRYGYTSTETGTPNRIASISEFVGTDAGGSVTISYGHNETTFTDHNGNSQIVQFNNWGNTISIQDDQGRAQYAQFAINEPVTPGDTQTTSEVTYEYAKGNQLRLSSKLQNTVGNLINYSSFEGSTGYWGVTDTNLVSVSLSSDGYYGGNSLRLTRQAAGEQSAGTTAGYTIEGGATYTFSAYVKTGTGSAYLEVNDGTASYQSEILPANSGWTRLQVSYTNTQSTSRTLYLRVMTKEAGVTHIDCVQLEKAPTASRYNLVENGDFRYAQDWNLSTGRVTLTENTAPAPQLSGNVYKMTGDPTTTNRISQTVNVSGEAGESFVVAGWARADSAPLDSYDTNPREFAIIATIHYTDGTTGTKTVRFNPCVNSWQYAADGFEAEKAFTHIVIELAYDYNVNEAYFDGIQLYNEVFGTKYSYNENGDVEIVEDIQGGTTTYTYTGSDLTSVTLPDGSVTTYEYDTHHNVVKATTNTGVVYTLAYDKWGNNTSVAITSGDLILRSSARYSADGNRLVSTTDTARHTTYYTYNEDTNLLTSVRYPGDTVATATSFTYDSMYRLYTSSVTTDQGTTMYARYRYTNDLLTSVITTSTTYTLAYNNFSQIQQIKAGGNTLASYTYTADQNKYLQKLAYGNGDSVQYSYDSYGRLIKQTWEDGDTVSYSYDNSGALATVTDSATGRTTTYYYDFTDRLTKYVESGADFYHSVSYVYSDADENGELKTLVETINDARITTGYNYDSDNRVTGVVHTINLDSDADAEATVSRGYQYDDFGRLSTRVAGNGTATPVVTDEFIYLTPATGATSGQVSQFKTTSAGSYSKTYTYTYDTSGNIASISDGAKTTSYVYDSQNQLLRENNENTRRTYVWTYDGAGNIVSKSVYAYTTGDLTGLTPAGTIAYTYGNAAWGDLLTGYDGKTLTYDTLGNLTSDGSRTFTWEHGRQLASLTSGTTIWSFAYNSDGLRTSRTNGTTTYNYVYNGSQLMQMTVGSNTLIFTYDASGVPLTVTYNGTVYYYVTNLQGDVVAILDASGTAVVQYTYDAWGYPISRTGTMSGTLGKHNPLRYRGYVYDQETGLCYLQSRYYNPEIGRFINADAYVSTGQGFGGNNMFAYCNNNPVMYEDPSGTAIQAICYNSDNKAYLLHALFGGGGGTSGVGCSSGSGSITGAIANVVVAASVMYAVVAVTSRSKVAVATKNNDQAECYIVYFLTEAGDPSQIIYVGRVIASGFDQRMRYHNSKGREFAFCITGLTYEECRAVEQGGMIYYHTINRDNKLMNQIRGVGPTNNNRSTYYTAIMELVKSGLYPDCGFLPASYWENLTEERWLNGGI